MSGVYFLLSLFIMMWIVVWSILHDKEGSDRPKRAAADAGQPRQQHKST